MSEPVEITNVQWSGTVPQWANEKTLKQIEDYIKDHTKLSKTELKKINKSLKELVKQGKKKCGTSGGSNSTTRAMDDLEDALNEVENSAHDLDDALDDLSESTEKQKKASSKTGKAIGSLSGWILSLGGKMAAMMMNQIDAYDLAYKSGLLIQDSREENERTAAKLMTNFAQLSTQAGMSMESLIDVSKKYGQAVHKFGIKGFAKNIGAMTTSLLSYGYRVSETSEFLGEYLEQSRRLGFLERNTHAQTMAAAENAAKSTAKWSQVMGKSRDQINEQLKEVFGKVDVENYLQGLGISDPAQAEKTRKSFEVASKMLPEELANMAAEMAATENPYANKQFKDLLASDASDLAYQVLALSKSIRAGTLTEENSVAEMEKLNQAGLKASRRFITYTDDAGRTTMKLLNDISVASSQMVTGLTTYDDLVAMKIAERDKAEERLIGTADSAVGASLANTGALETMTKGLNALSDKISANQGNISKIVGGVAKGVVAVADTALDLLIAGADILSDKIIPWFQNTLMPWFKDTFMPQLKKFGNWLKKMYNSETFKTAIDLWLKIPTFVFNMWARLFKSFDTAGGFWGGIKLMLSELSLSIKYAIIDGLADATKGTLVATNPTAPGEKEARITELRDAYRAAAAEEEKAAKIAEKKNASVTTSAPKEQPASGKSATPVSPQASTNTTSPQKNQDSNAIVTASLSESNSLAKKRNELAKRQNKLLQQIASNGNLGVV